MRALIVIDVQTGYPNKDWEVILPRVERLCDLFPKGVAVYYENHINTPVYKLIGWKYLMQGQTDVFEFLKKYQVLVKNSYNGATEELITYLHDNGIDEVFVCGVYTEACLSATCFGLFDAGFKVNLVSNCCYGTNERFHKMSIEIMAHHLASKVYNITEDNKLIED